MRVTLGTSRCPSFIGIGRLIWMRAAPGRLLLCTVQTGAACARGEGRQPFAVLLGKAGAPIGTALPLALRSALGGPVALVELRLAGRFEPASAGGPE
jgi:hypothetical protein